MQLKPSFPDGETVESTNKCLQIVWCDQVFSKTKLLWLIITFKQEQDVLKDNYLNIANFSMMSLKERWIRINERLGVKETEISSWWNTIQTMYSEKRRMYHTLSHLTEMFMHFDRVSAQLEQPDCVALAIYFHDVVYDPTQPDNEEQSAELFVQYAECIHRVDDLILPTVKDWILETKGHMTPVHTSPGEYGDTDLHHFLDMDMAVLGRPWEGYKEYAEQIRQEYIHIPDDMFRRRRAEVLTKFLEVPNIYATKAFRDVYEGQARQNISLEIASLTA